MLDISFSNFFDRKGVQLQLSKAEVKSLSKFGAYVRTDARRSIRKRKKKAKAGSPPSSHTGLLKNWILFFYDSSTKSVVIGPKNLGISKRRDQPIPALLEYGGTTSDRRGRAAEYSAFPYMRPAIERTQDSFVGFFANSFK